MQEANMSALLTYTLSRANSIASKIRKSRNKVVIDGKTISTVYKELFEVLKYLGMTDFEIVTGYENYKKVENKPTRALINKLAEMINAEVEEIWNEYEMDCFATEFIEVKEVNLPQFSFEDINHLFIEWKDSLSKEDIESIKAKYKSSNDDDSNDDDCDSSAENHQESKVSEPDGDKAIKPEDPTEGMTEAQKVQYYAELSGAIRCEQTKVRMVLFAKSLKLVVTDYKTARKALRDLHKRNQKSKDSRPSIKQPAKHDWSDEVAALFDLHHALKTNSELNNSQRRALDNIGSIIGVEFEKDPGECLKQLYNILHDDDNICLALRAIHFINEDSTETLAELCQDIGIEANIQTLNGWAPTHGNRYYAFDPDAGNKGKTKSQKSKNKKEKGEPRQKYEPEAEDIEKWGSKANAEMAHFVAARKSWSIRVEQLTKELRKAKAEFEFYKGKIDDRVNSQFGETEMPLFDS